MDTCCFLLGAMSFGAFKWVHDDLLVVVLCLKHLCISSQGFCWGFQISPVQMDIFFGLVASCLIGFGSVISRPLGL